MTSLLQRFDVQTSDVLQDMRVNVCLEGQVIWHKERFLDDKEIIENIIHTATNTICWTIHRPLRGWYIRIRSPAFPPGVSIPFTPVPSTAPYHAKGALSFNSRTNIPINFKHPSSSSSSIHSYPPHHPVFPSSQITQFILSPSQSADSPSFLSRALSAIKNHHPNNSFTLSRILHPPRTDGISSPPPPYASNASIPPLPERQQQPVLHTPLLVFHDQTPFLTLRSLTGLIELDQEEERTLGVDTSFWIAVALTFLEFLEERESYLAAIND